MTVTVVGERVPGWSGLTVGADLDNVGAHLTKVQQGPDMVRDPFAEEDQPDLQEVLDALDDPDCRTIVSVLEEPMTASEIADESDIPLSTTYRKIDRLTEAALLAEGTEIRPDGQHASTYAINFEEVVIALTEGREFEAEVTGRPRSPDKRLENLWSEVRKET